ncbi:MAG: hypothetical protein GXO77_16965 [Calditrichaeota bacterium]|nr:hypothetical protein [Calditrichota bacterium]
MERGDWKTAAVHFQASLKVKDKDSKKTRAYGTVFIKYYPHRELGICLYNLGKPELARRQLLISLRQSPTPRAREYLARISSGRTQAPSYSREESPLKTPEKTSSPKKPETEGDIGERLSIAVLPFSSQGIGSELGGVDLLDKLITGFVNSKRFKVIERAQLEKILEEQKLGLSGIVDPATAAEIGKGIGVDAVVLGSVTRAGNSLSIDARLIDTENATIISAQDAYSNQISLYQISEMINKLAEKFTNDLPLIKGLVINTNGDNITIDLGSEKKIKKGMKCIVYREGDPIVHPVSGKVIGKMIKQVCEARIVDVFPNYSIGTITKQISGLPQKLDKVITK